MRQLFYDDTERISQYGRKDNIDDGNIGVRICCRKKYEIVKEIAVAPADVNGWSLQLNLISWNENAPRYDLRAWSKERERMSKGKTLSTEEIMWLKNVLEGMDI